MNKLEHVALNNSQELTLAILDLLSTYQLAVNTSEPTRRILKLELRELHARLGVTLDWLSGSH